MKNEALVAAKKNDIILKHPRPKICSMGRVKFIIYVTK